MNPEKEFKVRFATLDDVPELRKFAGENEIPVKYLHESIVSERQKVILLEKGEELRGFIKARMNGEGVKIDLLNLPEDEEESLELLGSIEAFSVDEKIYTYVDKGAKELSALQEAGYEKDLETDANKLKMVKPGYKVFEDIEKEKEYYKKLKKVAKRFKVLQPRTVYKGSILGRNIEKLENKIEEMKGEKEKEQVECPECGDEFDSEKGMKIHKTKIHG